MQETKPENSVPFGGPCWPIEEHFRRGTLPSSLAPYHPSTLLWQTQEHSHLGTRLSSLSRGRSSFEHACAWSREANSAISSDPWSGRTTLWHEITTKITPWELFLVISEVFCALKMSRKERHFQGMTREIRDFSENNYFRVILRK